MFIFEQLKLIKTEMSKSKKVSPN